MWRSGVWAWLGILIFFISGCGSSRPDSVVVAEDGTSLERMGPAPLFGDYGADTRTSSVTEMPLGFWRLTVKPETLEANVEPLNRQGQLGIAIYNLDPTQFLQTDSFRITGVGFGSHKGIPTLDVTYEFKHPFSAPIDPEGTVSSENRADLGVSGRVLFLVEGTEAYFEGEVVVNGSLVRNAHGLYDPPDGLLARDSGFESNTAFPYLALVDEITNLRSGHSEGITGNRLDSSDTSIVISNGNDVRGNFDPTSGWQNFNIGPRANSWTGYGVLHQGQTVRSIAAFDREQVELSGLSTVVSVCVKYQDPRRAGRQSRLSTNDPSAFMYRMPHGALDIGRAEFLGDSPGFSLSADPLNSLFLAVEDWDARSTESQAGDFEDEDIATVVPGGFSGGPSVELSIPQVLGCAGAVSAEVADDNTLFPIERLTEAGLLHNDVGVDSGMADDPMLIVITAKKNPCDKPCPPVPCPPNVGRKGCLVRLTDASISAPGSVFTWFVSPDLLLLPGVSGEQPTYHYFEVMVAP